MFDKDKVEKSHYHYRYVCWLDLGQRTIPAVLKGQDGKIVNKLKIKKQADTVLRFLKGTDANVVMESGYNYQYLYDLLKSIKNRTDNLTQPYAGDYPVYMSVGRNVQRRRGTKSVLVTHVADCG
jgi:hypothetical protein